MTFDRDASDLPNDWAAALTDRGCDRNHLHALVSQIYDETPGPCSPNAPASSERST